MRKSVIAFALCASVLTACAQTGGAPPSLMPGAGAARGVPQGDSGYRVVYSFMMQPDGIRPVAGLTLVNGELWSTTSLGGRGTCPANAGCGTIFKVSTAGAETIAYRFRGTGDGGAPAAGLTLLGGKLYGTAPLRGVMSGPCAGPGCGTVFEIVPNGGLRAVYRFKGGDDGAAPRADLVNLNGTLYGTTALGGKSTGCGSGGCGVVFKVTPDGNESVVYAFQNSPDGALPLGGLTAIGGVLYGTTQQGGSKGAGAVFSVTPGGKETILYSFKGSPDGAGPVEDLSTSDKAPGVLYGITQNGGTKGTPNCGSTGCGTVYSVTTQGTETVLYRFKGSPDGTHPYAPITPIGDTLYGTTGLGGIATCYSGNGCGTIFKLTPSSNGYTETILYNFTVSGTYPQSGFTRVNGLLYGTSHGGGDNGFGSVYAFKP